MPTIRPKPFLAGLIQMNGSNIIHENIAFCEAQIDALASKGAEFIQLPEIANLVEKNASKLAPLLCAQVACPFLKSMQEKAKQHNILIHIGSLTLKNLDLSLNAAMAVNRGFFIDAQGQVLDFYDKIHMFDVALKGGEHYQESQNYQAGTRKIVINSQLGLYGMSICYDLRFADLYRFLAQKGALMMGVPAAFTATTGRLHWEVLLRARAIETSSFILAAAQTGIHKDGRKTHGHSMIIDPDGKILAKAGRTTGHIMAKIDLTKAIIARERIPAWRLLNTQ